MMRTQTMAWTRPRLDLLVVLVVLLVLVSSGPAEGASAKIARQGPSSMRAVALTFDDGWGESSCERIAKTLRKADVKGTFFINGVHLKAEPKRWRRILRDMPVGNHTRSHRNLVLSSSDVVRKQIRHNEKLHERILGRPMLKVFRPPYGASDSRVRRIAGELGYKRTVLWNVSAADTSPKATRASITRRTTGAPRGSIILMHCARSVTADALPGIIRHYKARGIKMVGLGELLRVGS